MTKNLALKLSAVALLAIPIGTARADLILSTIQLNSGQGFGSVETIFTLQAHGSNQTEQGCYAFGNMTGAYSTTDVGATLPAKNTTLNTGNFCTEGGANDVASGSPKNALPSFGDVGITNVSQVGLLLNNNQVSSLGITLTNMTLSFYTAGGIVIYSASILPTWCTSLTGPGALCSSPNTFLSSETGQGQNGFLFVLDAGQQAGLSAAITAYGITDFSSILVGAGGNFGCGGTQTATCKEANDGAESLQLANTGSIVTTPEPSTTALMATGFLGLVGVVRRRRQG